MNRPQKIRLGELLVQQQLITEEQLLLALGEQKKTGRKLGRVLVDSNFVTENEICQVLARQLKAPFVDLKQANPRPELVNLLPEGLARRFRAVVLDEQNGMLQVGMVDPTDLQAYDEIVKQVRREIDFAVVAESQLLTLFDRAYRRTEEIRGLAKELTAELGETPIEFGDGFISSSPGGEDAPVVKLLQTIFEEALKLRASDIHIEPQEKNLRIRFRIDGVLHVQMEADSKIAPSLALRLKLISGLDISEKRLPQDGRFNIKVRNAPVDIRISSLPTQYGESVVMRVLSQASGMIALEDTGMPPRVLKKLREAIHRPSGMVLVTGPTGSGKTTTLYSALSELNEPGRKIITVEDPVEYRLAGINQVQVVEKIDLTFERVLRSILRQDPDVVLVGEMRDQSTAEIGMRAAMTGHMVLSTLHTNDAVSTPVRLLDMGVPRYMVSLAVNLVIAQRLVRVICESCSEPYELQPHEHEWVKNELGDSVDRFTYKRGRGCPHCSDTGYQGRIAIFEMLEMTGELVDAINTGDTSVFMAAAKRQMGPNTLRRDAVRLVAMGKTTVAEAVRIANQGDD